MNTGSQVISAKQANKLTQPHAATAVSSNARDGLVSGEQRRSRTGKQTTDGQTTRPQSTRSQTTGPQGTGPSGTGPQGAGPQGTGPQGTGPQGTGPRATGPQSTRARTTGPQAIAPQRSDSLLRKLRLGPVIVGLVALVMLIGAYLFSSSANERLQQVLADRMRPALHIHQLQSALAAIHLLEVDIWRRSDPVRLAGQLITLRAQRSHFDHALAEFLTDGNGLNPAEGAGLEQHWQRYREWLQQVENRARGEPGMHTEDPIQSESSQRFLSLSKDLKVLADVSQARADAILEGAIAANERLSRILLSLGFAALIGVALAGALFLRALTGRLNVLYLGAKALAQGQQDMGIDVGGTDELTAIARSLQVLQQRLGARDASLRSARDDLQAKIEEHRSDIKQREEELQREILARRGIEDQLQHQAQHDSLTGLPNRSYAIEKLSFAIARAAQSQHQVVVLFLDLDHFKTINDSLGPSVGDSVLVQAAQRLRYAVRSGDIVAHTGGDEFLIILGDIQSREGARAMGAKILRAFATPLPVGDKHLTVTPSMGLAVFPTDGEDAETLLRNADLAMYDAKQAGRNTFRYYESAKHEQVLLTLSMESDLRLALAQREFHLVYQPVIDANANRVVAVEALVRWHSPSRGVLPAADFIPIADRLGLIGDIDQWVLDTACAQLRNWDESGWSELNLAINASLRHPRGANLDEMIERPLKRNGIATNRIQIEVTEDLLLENDAQVRQTFQTLSGMGVKMAIDDFGAGYSALASLKHYRFDILKIDPSLTRDVARDEHSRALSRAAVNLGISMGMQVIAEGVETAEQQAFLIACGVHRCQGHWIAPAMPAEEFELWYQKQRGSV